MSGTRQGKMYNPFFTCCMLIHGGIDRYSRMIVFLQCSNNNTALAVLQLFEQAIQKYGLLSRVRSDKGVKHSSCMAQIGGVMIDRGTFSWGTHFLFIAYSNIENSGLLDLLNKAHIFALHYVFLPQINKSPDMFREAYNTALLTIERGNSLTKLWIQALLNVTNSNCRVAQEFN